MYWEFWFECTNKSIWFKSHSVSLNLSAVTLEHFHLCHWTSSSSCHCNAKGQENCFFRQSYLWLYKNYYNGLECISKNIWHKHSFCTLNLSFITIEHLYLHSRTSSRVYHCTAKGWEKFSLEAARFTGEYKLSRWYWVYEREHLTQKSFCASEPQRCH